MVTGNLTWIVSYIWGMADDVLRRLDSVLEDKPQLVLDMKVRLDLS